MLSRVADSVYWMSRYIERAENVARFVDVNIHLMLDAARSARTSNGSRWWTSRATMRNSPGGMARPPQANVIQFLTFDGDNPNSILSCLRAARENARSVREIISSEMWLQLNKLLPDGHCRGGEPGQLAAPTNSSATPACRAICSPASPTRTMTHGEGWHFGRLGRMLERADKTSRILDVKYFILLPTVADVGTTV